MKAAGIPLNKIVIGKPMTQPDAPGSKVGYMDNALLKQCLVEAKVKGYDSGVMTWQYHAGSTAGFYNNAIKGVF